MIFLGKNGKSACWRGKGDRQFKEADGERGDSDAEGDFSCYDGSGRGAGVRSEGLVFI